MIEPYLGHGGVVQVAQLGVTLTLRVPHVLSQDDVLHLQHAGTLQHLHLQWRPTAGQRSDVSWAEDKQDKTAPSHQNRTGRQ